jgi:hypothetical protein
MTARSWIIGVAASLLATSALAQPPAPDAKRLIDEAFLAKTREWLANPIVALSVKAQNDRNKTLSQSVIDSLDKQWRAEREGADKPLIAATLSAPLSTYLLRVQAESLGLYTEIFVMDRNGLNVGQSAPTSDYWQGDEAKFQKTFLVGSDAVFVDEAEWDDENKIWRAQLNLTLSDASGSYGAATIEINLTEMQRRSAPSS